MDGRWRARGGKGGETPFYASDGGKIGNLLLEQLGYDEPAVNQRFTPIKQDIAQMM